MEIMSNNSSPNNRITRNLNGFQHKIRRMPFWIRYLTLRIEDLTDYNDEELGFSQQWKIYHNKLWIWIEDYYYDNKKWVLKFRTGERVSFWEGKCLNISPEIEPGLLFKILKLITYFEPEMESHLPKTLIIHKKYKDFSQGFTLMTKVMSST